jgi:hypothetical protein
LPGYVPPDARSTTSALALISPAHHENVGFYRTFSFDVDLELAQLAAGCRPLGKAST